MSRQLLNRTLRAALTLALLSCTETTAPDTTVATVSVSVPRPMVRVGESIQATARILNAEGSELSTSTVTWSSSNTSIATVSTDGIVAALVAGDVVITATADGKVGQTTLKITIVPIFSITISPSSTSIPVGHATVLAATAKDSAGNALSGRTINWTSSDLSKAIVSSGGIVVGLAPGTVDVTASAEGVSASGKVEVTLVVVPVASVTVSLPRTAFRVGESVQAGAIPLDASGGVLVGRTINWSSSNPEIAAVLSSGLVTGVSPGTAIISAEVEGKVGSTTVQISLVPVGSVSVTPSSETISSGATVTLTTVVKDSAGQVVTGRSVTWSSVNTNIATVSQVGVVTGLAVGTTDIVATVEGKQGQATITVNTASTAVATVSVSPANADMSGGGTRQLTATLRDASGNVLAGRSVTWSSSNPDRATVSPTGLVTASVVDAPVVITATSEGKSGTASIGIITLVRMSAGFGYSCALTADGTAYCWGLNSRGQLGDATFANRLTPTKVSTTVKFATIAAGFATTCGIALDGPTYCWGSSEFGQGGSGGVGNNISSPRVTTGGYRFLSVAVGSTNACGTTSDQDVYCWGKTREEIVGGPTNQSTEPVPLFVGRGMVAVVAGLDDNFCSVDAAGLAYCWTVTFTVDTAAHTVLFPVRGPVSTTQHFTTLRVGFGHVCGLESSGQAYCWGRNDLGQLGDGTTTAHSDPAPVSGGLQFQSLAAGGGFVTANGVPGLTGGFSCGLTQAGKAYCWGANVFGQLGIGSQSDAVLTPQPVAGGISFTGLRAGATHTCGLAVGGPPYCWGSNAFGQFGDGTTNSASQPSPVFER